jgi:protein O-mannosyl-transferase
VLSGAGYAKISIVPVPPSRPSSKKTAESGLFASAEKRNAVAGLLLVVITLAAYNPVASHPFVNYDDDRYVTANPHVRQGLSDETIWWALTSTDQANWHPLTWISHALDYSLFRLNPAGHHFSSLLIHAANVALLFLLLAWSTRQIGPSVFVALLFALHPINVESVAWVAERKNVLCTFFFLLTLGAYGWYVRKAGGLRYLAVVALFICGLAAKPMVITLPFALLLVDYWPLGRIRGLTPPTPFLLSPQKTAAELALEKLPLVLLSAASAAITLVAQQAGGAMRSTRQFSFAVRLANAIHAYAVYLWLAVWPARLAPLYPHPGNSLTAAQIALPAVVLVTITALALRLRARRYLLAGWLWFLGTLVPVIGLVQVGDQAMADRYAYIPLIGIFAMVAFGIADLVRWRQGEPQIASGKKVHRAYAIVAGAAALIVLAMFTVATRVQLSYWQTSESLWRHTLAVTDRNFIAHNNLGGALLLEGKTEEAFSHFRTAAQINPRDPMSRGNIGAHLIELGQFGPAIDELQQVINLTSDRGLQADAYANLGTAYRQSGDPMKARESYEESLRINQSQPTAWLGMGILLDQQGDAQQAALDFARAAEIQPNPRAFFLLGRTLARLDRKAEARAAFENALKLQPDFADAQAALDSLGQH